jgi:large subunit ribosomal protein L35
MPKMKSNSGAKKRFKLTGTGRVKRNKAYRRHILTKKTTTQKRRLRKKALVDKTQEHQIKAMLPYAH